jgi:uncharacterized repeat protein (TIGR01451 family)
MITNVASVTGNESDPDPGNNTAEKSVRVIGADLVVTKTVNITAPNAGDVITYTITVANNGPDNATGVQLVDVLPAGVSFGGYTATQGTYITATGLWDLKDDLPSGAVATLTITATVNSCSGHATITNTASVTADWPNDPKPDNNKFNVVITPTSGAYCLFLPIILKPPPLPCYVETFDDPNSGWPPPPTSPLVLVEYLNGEYHMFTKDTTRVHWATSPLGPYYNYSVQVDARWTTTTYIGDEYGIVFDLFKSGGRNRYYRFNINTNRGTYRLRKLQNGRWSDLIVPTSSPDIRGGSSVNTLRVERNNFNIDLYINGKYQASCPDLDNCPNFDNPLPRPGYMGVNVVPSDLIDGEAYFDNFTVCTYELSGGTSINRLGVRPASGATNK